MKKTPTQKSISHQNNLTFSLIVTVLNESNSIEALLISIVQQTVQPDQLIIVDGGSTDDTVKMIKNFARRQQWSSSYCQVFVRKGNRSVGRNAAIVAATSNWIAITDAGCVLEPDWLAALTKAAQAALPEIQVLAGYYTPYDQTAFQRAAAPFFLVMPDQVDPQAFLPATRSMALSKRTWERYGGFPEAYSDNEDYVFAKKLQQAGEPILFVGDAVVKWQPPRTLFIFAKTLFRFARGDMAAGIVRPKVLLLIGRYAVGITVIVWLANLFGWWAVLSFVVTGGFIYSVWSITKLYRYTKKEWHYVPLLQFVADLAVLTGSLIGYVNWLANRLVSWL